MFWDSRRKAGFEIRGENGNILDNFVQRKGVEWAQEYKVWYS